MASNSGELPQQAGPSSAAGGASRGPLAAVRRALGRVWARLPPGVREELEAAAGDSPAATRASLPPPVCQLSARAEVETLHVKIYANGQCHGSVVERAYQDEHGQIVATRTMRSTGLLSWVEEVTDAAGQAVGSIEWGASGWEATAQPVPLDLHDAAGGPLSSVSVQPPAAPVCRLFGSDGREVAAVMKRRHWLATWYTLVRGERVVGVLEHIRPLEWRIAACEAEAPDPRLLVFLAASQAVTEAQQIRAARDQ